LLTSAADAKPQVKGMDEVFGTHRVVDDNSHEGLRSLLRQERVSFQRLKTWKQSTDLDYQRKQDRVLHLYGLMDGTCDVADVTLRWSSAWTSSAPSTSSPTPAASGPSKVGAARRRVVVGGRPSRVPTGCGTCWPPMT